MGRNRRFLDQMEEDSTNLERFDDAPLDEEEEDDGYRELEFGEPFDDFSDEDFGDDDIDEEEHEFDDED